MGKMDSTSHGPKHLHLIYRVLRKGLVPVEACLVEACIFSRQLPLLYEGIAVVPSSYASVVRLQHNITSLALRTLDIRLAANLCTPAHHEVLEYFSLQLASTGVMLPKLHGEQQAMTF